MGLREFQIDFLPSGGHLFPLISKLSPKSPICANGKLAATTTGPLKEPRKSLGLRTGPKGSSARDTSLNLCDKFTNPRNEGERVLHQERESNVVYSAQPVNLGYSVGAAEMSHAADVPKATFRN